jgi:hypothetical protein
LGLAKATDDAVDHWEGGQYSRVIVADSGPLRLSAIQEAASVEPTLTVTVESTTRISERTRMEIGQLVQKMFGLAVDLHLALVPQGPPHDQPPRRTPENTSHSVPGQALR